MRYTFRLYFATVLLLAGLLLVNTAQAGEYDYDRYEFKSEAFAILGTGTWYDDDSGLILGGGVLFRPYPKAGFEISYRNLETGATYQESSFRESGHSMTASVHYYFSQLRFQPYLLLGGGFVWTERASDYYDPFSGIRYDQNYKESSFVLEAGGGADIFVTQKVSVRPEVRLMLGVPGMLLGAINLCYHW